MGAEIKSTKEEKVKWFQENIKLINEVFVPMLNGDIKILRDKDTIVREKMKTNKSEEIIKYLGFLKEECFEVVKYVVYKKDHLLEFCEECEEELKILEKKY